jgi:hypothetical protein
MAKANSLTTRVRQWLSNVIDPMPPWGEAWCMNCSLVEGRTAVVNSDGLRNHVLQHKPGENLFVKRLDRTDLELEKGPNGVDQGPQA